MKSYNPTLMDSTSVGEPMATYGTDMNALRVHGVNMLMQIESPKVLKGVLKQLQDALAESRTSSPSYWVAQHRLEQLSKLSDGWDGDEAVSVDVAVLRSAEDMIKMCDSDLLQSLSIMPDTNGTLLFDFKTAKGKSVLNMGTERISFFIKRGTKIVQMKEASCTKQEMESYINQLYQIL